MSTLLIDAGNSSIKWAVLNARDLSQQKNTAYKEATALEVFNDIIVSNSEQCLNVVMVSVLGDLFVQQAKKLCTKSGINFRNVTSVTFLGNVSNSYKQAHKLGADRLVAMIAAYNMLNTSRSDPSACIIIDSGTATTIDAVDATGQHLGGLILPGIELCRQSLLDNTQQLSKWNDKEAGFLPTLFAKETTEAISNASIFGQVTAIDGICDRMEKEIVKKNKDVSVKRFLCGGSAQQLLPLLEREYRLHQDLVLKGLQFIINSEER